MKLHLFSFAVAAIFVLVAPQVLAQLPPPIPPYLESRTPADGPLCDIGEPWFPLIDAAFTGDLGITYDRAFVDQMIAAHNMNLGRWGWGWGMTTDTSDPAFLPGAAQIATPFGRTMSALRVLHDSALPNTPSSSIATWGGDYVLRRGHELMPMCGNVNGRASPWPVGGTFQNALYQGVGSFRTSVWRRAASIVHETRHFEAGGHDLVDLFVALGIVSRQCEEGVASTPERLCCKTTSTSCDRNYFNWGANSVHIHWMMEALKYNQFIGTAGDQNARTLLPITQQERIVNMVNSELDGRFAESPGFFLSSGAAGGAPLGQVIRDPSVGAVYSQVSIDGNWVLNDTRDLGSVGTTGCYFTKLSGQFRSLDESIRLISDGAPAPQWKLTGTTGAPPDSRFGILAYSDCVATSGPVTNHHLDLNESYGFSFEGKTELLPENVEDRVCYLSGISGNLQSTIEGAWVEPDFEEGQWRVTINTADTDPRPPHRPIEVWVQCIQADLKEVSWVGESSDLSLVSSDSPSGADTIRCAISGLLGRFEGRGEAVEILPNLAPRVFPVDWVLRTYDDRNDGNTTQGHAVCFAPR